MTHLSAESGGLPAATVVDLRLRDSRLQQERQTALPDLTPAAPPEQAPRPWLPHADGGFLKDEPTDFRLRPEARDPVARLTVYVLNAIVMVLVFPVGFGLLIFNILGGENLRTTAHTLALTGTGMGLASAVQAATAVL